MLRKKYQKTILATILTVTIIGGIGSITVPTEVAQILGTTNVAYADASTFNPNAVGLKTPTGWVTSKIKCEDNLPNSATLDEMLAMSKEAPSEITYKNGRICIEKMNLTDEIYHEHFVDELGFTHDEFIKMISIELVDDPRNPGGFHISKKYSVFVIGTKDGSSTCGAIRYFHQEYKDTIENHPWYLQLEKEMNEAENSKPTDPEKPVDPTPTKPEESKSVTAKILGGLTRFETATAIAKEVNSEKLDAVVLANAFTFPDALTGTTLATQKNSPILLVGSGDKDSITFDYMKNNLKAGGTVYALGGTTAISSEVEAKIKAMGYNIKRLGGSDRYATNMSIVNELNVAKGSDIVIGNSLGYADNLSISGIAGKKNMPILLVNNEVTPELLAKIKSIAPKNIYILGGTTAVNADVESKLKTVGNVVRLGGLDRYETSLKIANYFTDGSQNTALVAYGLNFPDALTGGALAGKTGAPVLLVNKEAEAQKKFINSKNINNIYILGGETAVGNSIINELKK